MRRLLLLALCVALPAAAQTAKLMNAPAYALGPGTVFDMTPGRLILPNGSLPTSCKSGEAYFSGGILNICSSVNTWTAIPMLSQAGQIAPIVVPPLNTLAGQLTASQLPATITSDTSGKAATANAFAATPNSCPTGQYTTGVQVNGNAICSAVQASQVNGLSPSGLIDVTNAGNISSGTLNTGRLPSSVLLGSQINLMNGVAAPVGSPSAGLLYFWADAADQILKARTSSGKISISLFPAVAALHQVVTGVTTAGTLQFSQMSAGDILGLAPSAITDTTSASNILSGTLNPARLPTPGANTLGAVNSVAFVAHQWVDSISTAGAPHTSQPQASDILGLSNSAVVDATNAANITSGILNPLHLPSASLSAIGGVQAFAPQSHQWLTGISTSGIVTASQPSFGDIAGTLGGDLGGTLANPTVLRINGISVSASNAANQVLGTTAQGAANWLAIPACSDSAGQHLNYDAVNHLFSCGNSVPTAGGIGFGSLGSGTNTTGALLVGSGSSLAPTGTGTITANAFTGTLNTNNLPASLLYGNQVLTLTSQQPPAQAQDGKMLVWADSNDLNLKAKNGNGYTSVTVFPQAPAAHQVVTGIAANGSVSQAQLTADDIQGIVASGKIDTTNAGNISSGTLPPARLPLPTPTTPGGILSQAATAHTWIDSILTNGQPHASQPQAADVNGLAPSATIDTTSASNVTHGTLPLAQLPSQVLLAGQINVLNQVSAPLGVPAVGNLAVWADSTDGNLRVENHTGATSITVKPQASVAHKFVTGLSSDGTVSLGQPQASDIGGLAPSATTDTTSASNILTGTLNASLLPSTIAANTSGSAATSAALAGTPTVCPSGQFATGIAPNGNAICSVITLSQLAGGSGSGPLTVNAANVVGGVLSDSVIPNDVASAVTSDTNVTGSINSKMLTLGWAGTLAANRLNANVVQNVTNDSNVTATIASQRLTLGWAGNLPITRGGTGAADKASAFNALAPTTNLGDIIYSNGTGNVPLPGNRMSTTDYLCQTGTGTSSAAPQWCTLPTQQQSAPTNASTITSGTLPSGQLPLPTVVAPGAVKGLPVVPHQFVIGLDTGGNLLTTQPQASDIQGLATSSFIDTTNANNIVSGQIKNSLLPANITANTSGNAATASALLNTPPPCQTGLYAIGSANDGTPNCTVIQYSQIANLPTIPTDNTQLANSARYITGAQVPSYLPATAVLNNQFNTYFDQFEPLTPADGFTQVWTDKVNMVLTAKNWQGYRTITVGPSQAPINQFANGLTLNGIITYAPIYAYQIQGLSNSGMIDVTNASNITSGTLPLNIFPTTINSNTTGNAATATALQNNPQICLGDTFAVGILATGNAICKAAPTGGGGGTTTAPLATTTTAGIVIPSTGTTIDGTGALRVAYGKQSGTALDGGYYGTAYGVATLDGGGLVPQAELPYVNKVQLPITALQSCNSTTLGQLAHIAGSTSGATDQVGACIYNGTQYVWLWFGTGGGTGGGGSNLPVLYKAFTNATLVTFADNAGSTALIPTVFDTSGNIIEYNQATISDGNDFSLSFSVPQSGGVWLTRAAYVLPFVNATSVAIPHNLNSYNIIPLVLDGANTVMQPNTFVLSLTDYNNGTLTFAQPTSGTLLIMDPVGAYSQTFTATTGVTVSHGLNSVQLAGAVYDTNNSLMGYTSLGPISTNSSLLTFATAQSGRIVMKVP